VRPGVRTGQPLDLEARYWLAEAVRVNRRDDAQLVGPVGLGDVVGRVDLQGQARAGRRGVGTIISKWLSVLGPSFQLRWGKPAGMKTSETGPASCRSSPSCAVMVPLKRK
jgi:hypothetical protein